MSLGFNLTGSLAAIDKWVEDNHSEEDEDFDQAILKQAVRGKASNSNYSSRASSGCSRVSDVAIAPGSDGSVSDAPCIQDEGHLSEMEDRELLESKRISAEILLSKEASSIYSVMNLLLLFIIRKT